MGPISPISPISPTRMKNNNPRWLPLIALTALLSFSDAQAQQLLSLDSCRAMALRNNKQLSISRLKQDVAANLRRSARTKYLPHVSAIGTYEHTSKEISILNNDQKNSLLNLGNSFATGMQGALQPIEAFGQQVGTMLQQLGIPAEAIQQMMGGIDATVKGGIQGLSGKLNSEGEKIVDAFRTDTRNVWSGSVLAIQPVFMGGSIVAMNRLADLNEQLAANSANARQQAVIYATDQAYWQVVSLKNKKRLAESYLELLRKLDSDVQKMINEGVATRSDGLSVSVKVSEAEMTVQKVNDGLVLSKMLLCQTIGLPMNETVTLADEDSNELATPAADDYASTESLAAIALDNRPELKMLETTADMSHQLTNIMKAANLPQVALMGGYAVSNPNVFNGFEKKFGGFWNVGLLVRVPIWNWGDKMYKVRATKGATAIANLEVAEAREKIELQVNQQSFRVEEAAKRLAMANAGIEKANENLRTANLGFSEGVITPTVVREAQTAWLQAQSQKIDAEIDVCLSRVDMRKALGKLVIEN